MTRSDTWLIVPVYNEGTVVGDVVADARQTFSNIVCVDDGSRDNSADVVLRAGAHLVRHPANLGQGAALQTGIEYALRQPGSRYFVTFDSDGQHQVADVKRLLDALSTGEVDLAIGTRFRGDTSHIPWVKRVVLRSVVALSPRLRTLQLTDSHNGLRAFTRPVAEQIHITQNGMGHASEIVGMVGRHGWRVTEVPVTILYTDYSRAKGQSIINGVNILFENVLRVSSRR